MSPRSYWSVGRQVSSICSLSLETHLALCRVTFRRLNILLFGAEPSFWKPAWSSFEIVSSSSSGQPVLMPLQLLQSARFPFFWKHHDDPTLTVYTGLWSRNGSLICFSEVTMMRSYTIGTISVSQCFKCASTQSCGNQCGNHMSHAHCFGWDFFHSNKEKLMTATFPLCRPAE